MQTNSSRWRNQRGPTIRDAYSTLELKSSGHGRGGQGECGEEEEGCYQLDDELEPDEEAPQQDPAQLALEQQQERERRRLESQRMKERFSEKTRLPKYQVRPTPLLSLVSS
jgi:hypothetical protein